MSLFQTLGFITDDAPKPEAKKEVSQKIPETIPVAQPIIFNTTSPIDDGKYIEILTNALNEASKKNSKFDLVKFQSIMNTLAATIPDEKSRYLAAFGSASVMNSEVTLDSLIASSDDFLKIISNEQTGFDSAISSVESKEITSRKNRVEQIESRKKEIIATIEKLNKESSDLSQEELGLSSEISAKTIEVESKKSAFASARNKIENSINTVKNNLKTYIQK